MIELTGYVFNQAQPLEGAAVYLKNHPHLGSVVTSTGSFKFNISSIYARDTIVFSHVGFETEFIPILQYTSIDTVRLNPVAQILDEVVISDRAIDLNRILLDAVKEIPKNYPNKKHVQRARYRHTATEETEYTYLAEANVYIEQSGYGSNADQALVSLDDYFQTKDYGKIDPVVMELYSEMRKKSVEIWQKPINSFYTTLSGNYIRNYKDSLSTFNHSLLSKFIHDHYVLKATEFKIEEGDTILTIAFSEGIQPKLNPSGLNYFKVNMNDQAIVEYQFTRGFPGRLIYQCRMVYEKYSGRYYPKYLRETMPRYINSTEYDDEYDIKEYFFESPFLGGLNKSQKKDVVDSFQYEISCQECTELELEEFLIRSKLQHDSVILESIKRYHNN